MISAGILRSLLEVQQRTETRDDHGQAIPTFTTEFKRRARIEPLSGLERIEAERTTGNVTHKITIRYYAGLTPEYRLLEDRAPAKRIFNIVSVFDPDERRRDMVIMAKEDVVLTATALYDFSLYDDDDTYG